MTDTNSRALVALACVSFVACGGEAVDMGGAWEGGTDGDVAEEAGEAGVDASADDAEASIPPGCSLPGPDNGEALIRIGNLVTSSQRVDFCINQKAVFASAAGDCPKGLAYKQMSVPFHVPDGDTTVKVIAYGDSCDGSGIMTGDLSLKTNQTRTVLLLGDGQSAPKLLIGAESQATTPSSYTIRFVHAAPHMVDLDFGLVNGADPPGYLYVTFGRDYSFGSAIPGVPLSLMNGNGYVEPQAPAGSQSVGVAPYDSSQEWNIQATFAAKFNFQTGSSYTVFMIGRDAQDPAYPYQLWACREYPSSTDGVFSLCSDNPEYSE